MPTDPTAGLRSALATTAGVLDRVRPDQAALPSPCPEWTVQDVVDHLAGNVGAYASALGAEPGDGTGFAAAAGRLVAALDDLGGADDAADQRRLVTVPMGRVPLPMALGLATVEVLVHGWDVATATGQQAAWDDAVAEEALAFSERAVGAVPPGRSPFGPPQPVAPTAPATDRLVALLGRTPGAGAQSTER